MFELLKQRLRFKKGALLLPEGDSLLVPWVCSGFDTTSMRRLRIPSDFVLSRLGAKASPVQIIEGQRLAGFGPYLSSRELGLIERLAACAFFQNDSLIGLFIMADGPYLARTGPVRMILAAVATTVPPRLFSARVEKIRKTVGVPTESREAFLTRLEDLFLLARERAMNFYCGKLAMTRMLAAFAKTAPDVDRYRLGRDIAAILATMLHGSPIFVDNEGDALYFGGIEKFDHPELLIHQLESALKDFFREIEGLDDLGFSLFAFPEDGNSFAEIIDKLFG